jgi:aminopeptidase
MLDPRYTKLANTLIHYSCEVKKGETVLIEAFDIPHEFTQELVRVCAAAGGRPLVLLKNAAVTRALKLAGTPEQWAITAKVEALQMKSAQCYIGLRGSANVSEESDIPRDKQILYEKSVWTKVHKDIRVDHTKWVVLRWPSASMAQMAEMSTEAFENYFFDVCTMDYARMSKAMLPLKKLMESTDRVRILGPRDTDLSFSIKNIPALLCDGHRNIPDGEVYTAPVRDSVNGIIHYNVPTLYRGVTHTDVRLVFKNGKIVEATSNATDKLNEVFDTDPGARYVGEFAIGFNPFCTKPMKDILFDEKIAGSIHFTPGSCYEQASNGNKSAIHWDLVLRQDKASGGGTIHFDDKLIRKDGHFVLKELAGLNPEKLR